MRATWPHSVLPICADQSLASDRKMRVRSVWEQRPPRLGLAEHGTQRRNRLRGHDWDQMRLGSSEATPCFEEDAPRPRDRPGFVPAGIFRQSTLPLPITSSSGGSRRAAGASPGGSRGQNVAAMSGRSKTERKTLRPSMMLERSFESMVTPVLRVPAAHGVELIAAGRVDRAGGLDPRTRSRVWSADCPRRARCRPPADRQFPHDLRRASPATLTAAENAPEFLPPGRKRPIADVRRTPDPEALGSETHQAPSSQ